MYQINIIRLYFKIIYYSLGTHKPKTLVDKNTKSSILI